ncbi:MAG: 2-keto-4-pentenoate hydratase [Polaromonas sp.]|nr:2-keto-4-pentenoate hydratase [Polaromonas sp.]
MTYSLLTYEHNGQARAGLLDGDRVHDLAEASGRPEWVSMLEMLQQWEQFQRAEAAIASRIAQSGVQGLALAATKLLSPVLYPGAIYCAGANYKDHVAEMFKAEGRPMGPTMKDRGDKAWHFMKAPRACIAGPDAVVQTPPDTHWLDWEIELAAVIGKTARHVSAGDALGYVAGYTVANDLSARDHMRRDKQDPSSPFHIDWIGHKCFDGSCPVGPWIVPASAIADPHQLAMKLWVGDELMQDSNSSQLIFDIGEQIEALSARVTLYPGDLILTGTPAGVGMGRKRFLKPGEQVRLWIESIGEFRHRIA